MARTMTTEQLRKAYYEGGGPPKPYACSCGKDYAVSDDRRECRLAHGKKSDEKAA
jgi:hypothetical protein